MLASNGYDEVTVEDYKFGCRFTTPERFNVHIGGVEALGRPEGEKLGQIFDDTYVARVSRSTAGLFPVTLQSFNSICSDESLAVTLKVSAAGHGASPT